MHPSTRELPGAGSLSVQRVTSVDEHLAQHLNRLFDEGMFWDRTQGMLFLSDPSNLLLVALWDDQPCGFATAYRLQRFDHRRAEVNRWAREMNAAETWVLTEPTNAAARALYRATDGVEDRPAVIMYTYHVDPSP